MGTMTLAAKAGRKVRENALEKTPEQAPEKARVVYPDSDGTPMAETDYHLEQMIENIESLRYYFRERDDVYVTGNIFVYYEEGEPKRCFAPDLMVVFGVAKHKRRVWCVWEEKAPDFVMEVTSSSTARKDQYEKRRLYKRLGIREYVLFDPMGDYLKGTRLRFFRLEGGDYVEVLPRKDGVYESRVLGLKLRVRGDRLRFLDPATGEPLPTRAEFKARLTRVERARTDAERRAAAEARRREEAERAKAEEARRREEAERAKAEAERRAAEEARRREDMERELARLKALLESGRGG